MWIGYDTETVQLMMITKITFTVQFFNSAFLLLFVNAALGEQPGSFGLLTGGSMGDFNSQWFRTVGNVLIVAMNFNLYYPLLESTGYWALRFYGRCCDRGCTCDDTRTKTTSIQQYVNTYAGPVYFMHYKYSSIMTIAFITFIYGFGIPLLFPIACVSFIVLYLVEKLLLFYAYRLPPMYDERLSQDVLSKLQFAPLIYLAFGYWMASNQQLISNDHLLPMTSTTDVPLTDHLWTSVFTGNGWAGFQWPLLMAFFILLMTYFFGEWCEDVMHRCCGLKKLGESDLNEDIDTYWNSLDEGDFKWTAMEAENTRKLLIDEMMLDSAKKNLETERAAPKEKSLQGVHSYDILANPLYLDDFQYVSAAEGEDRAQFIIDDDLDEENDAAQSDLVRVALFLAYMEEEEAKNFQFTPQGLKGSKAMPGNVNAIV